MLLSREVKETKITHAQLVWTLEGKVQQENEYNEWMVKFCPNAKIKNEKGTLSNSF
jgi:hypothetical protein